MKIDLARKFVSPALIEGLLNTILDQMNPAFGLPPLYGSGIQYRTDYGENWQDPETTARLGYGDCEDLCLYRCAELRLNGYQARCTVYRSAPRLMHVIVNRMDGRYEDPSRALGMGRTRMGEEPEQDIMPAGFKITPAMVLDPQAAMKNAATHAAMNAAASLVPGGSLALELLASPEGRQLASVLLKKARKFW